MHSELRTFMKAGQMLLRIEDKLADGGVRATRQDHGYAAGVFGESYGAEHGIALVWCVWVNPETVHGDDGASPPQDEDSENVKVEIGVGISLHFNGSSLFGLMYDTANDKWYRYLTHADPWTVLSEEATAFAKTHDVTKPSDPMDRIDPISEERAFEIVASMGAYAKKHVQANVSKRTPTAVTTAIVKTGDDKKPGGNKLLN